MAVIYGWPYATFHANVGWDKGLEPVYNYWENFWAAQVDSIIFDTAGVHLTVAAEMTEIQAIVNKMMILTNLYLKAESTESPLGTGFYTGPGFPVFEENDLKILDKYKRKYGEVFARADSIRVGVDPESNYFGIGRLMY